MSTEDKAAVPTITQNEDGSTTQSYKLSEMSLDQLVMLNQALGRKKDEIRTQQLQLRVLIDKKTREQSVAHLRKQIEDIERGVINGEAPGAVLEVQASTKA